MADKEMEKLLGRVHKDINVFDFNGKNVPMIILGDRKFDDIMSKIQGKAVSVNTNLNILQEDWATFLLKLRLIFPMEKYMKSF